MENQQEKSPAGAGQGDEVGNPHYIESNPVDIADFGVYALVRDITQLDNESKALSVFLARHLKLPASLEDVSVDQLLLTVETVQAVFRIGLKAIERSLTTVNNPFEPLHQMILATFVGQNEVLPLTFVVDQGSNLQQWLSSALSHSRFSLLEHRAKAHQHE